LPHTSYALAYYLINDFILVLYYRLSDTFFNLVAEQYDLVSALGTACSTTQTTDAEIVNQLCNTSTTSCNNNAINK